MFTTGQILVLIFTKCSNMIFRRIYQLFWLLFENAFFSWLFSRWGFPGHDSLVIYVVLSMADTLLAPSVVAKQHTRVHPMMNGFVWRTIFKFALMAALDSLNKRLDRLEYAQLHPAATTQKFWRTVKFWFLLDHDLSSQATHFAVV